jgi:2-polyprenyl-3-methyl-5-hydroxy-6-metoxy-1,4-benzoquinol methylase
MALQATVVQLSSLPLHPLAIRERQRIVKLHGEERHRKSFPDYDWQRLSFLMGRIGRGAACLEVGPGRAFLSNMMAGSRRFQRQVAIDIVPRRRRMRGSIEFYEMSIAELSFPDGSFDCVLCTEVLEHLEDEALAAAIAHLRRVNAGRLIISVPFVEPIPLSRFHRQRFDEARVKELFPSGKYTVLLKEPVTRVPWLVIEERAAPA